MKSCLPTPRLALRKPFYFTSPGADHTQLSMPTYVRAILGPKPLSSNYKVEMPEKNSLEHTLLKNNDPFLFIDFENSGLKERSFGMRVPFGRFLQPTWSKHFSGVFFIKKTYPVNFLNPGVLLTEEELK